MDFNKILGIICIILGIIFVVYPVYSAGAVSWIAAISLIFFGFVSIINGFSVWSMLAHVSIINIILGILSILLGILFIYRIDALSFFVGFQFYLIAFVLIFTGIFGIIYGPEMISKLTSLLIVILGIIFIYFAGAAIAQPLYAAVFVGICLILDGIDFFIIGGMARNLVKSSD